MRRTVGGIARTEQRGTFENLGTTKIHRPIRGHRQGAQKPHVFERLDVLQGAAEQVIIDPGGDDGVNCLR